MMNILERLSTSELDARLHDELHNENPNGELVRTILGILEDREKDYPVELTPKMQEAWDKFANEEHGRKDRRKPTARSWVKRAVSMAATAAILCVVLFGIIPQPAKADSWWDILFNFTDSVFQFFNPEEAHIEHGAYTFKTDNPGLQQVYDAVVELGVTEPVVPSWLPDGYELEECTVMSAAAMERVYANFVSEDGVVVYKAEIYDENVWHEYHKDEFEVVEYEMSGVVHKVMQNNGRNVAVWTKDNIECSISVSCNDDTIFGIIDSIYSVEDK